MLGALAALCAATTWALLPAATPAHAQADGGRSIAAPFLPPDHWLAHALRRLTDLGLAPHGFDAHVPSLRVAEAANVLDHALDEVAGRDDGVAALVRGYAARFSEEFGAWADAAADPDAYRGRLLGGGSAGAGYERDSGGALAGIGYSNLDDWTGPADAPDDASARAAVWLGASLAPYAAFSASPVLRDGGRWLEDAHATLELGTIGAWGGRREIGFQPGAGGGIVLSGTMPLDGGGLFLARPLRLPWIFRTLGPVRGEMLLARIENGDRIQRPWFWAARVSVSPHPRVRIGVNRGAMFGGDGGAPVTLENLWLMFYGEHAGAEGEFANQLLSLDARYRLPLSVPLAAHVEWGTDDLTGGWWRSPALVAGLTLAALPGLPSAQLGIEHSRFSDASIVNPMWYRNWAMRGGWTHERRPLGHPLAGHGHEWLLHGSLDAAEARLRISARGYLRDRGAENLFAPDRAGGSYGAAFTLRWRAAAWLEVDAGGEVEDGSRDWSRTGVRLGGRAVF